ncbi:increased sodium tolerance protein 2 [Monosporozyma unispora]|nr:hypothetical protein C6P44_000202 [Kazachstania unispora]
MTNLEKLDPNYVIVFPNEGQNEADLIAVLQRDELISITKPGNANNACYMFTRITNVQTYIEIENVLGNLPFVTKHYPFFDTENSKHWDNLYLNLNPGKFSFPTPKSYQLQSLAEISKNPKLALYFEYFNHYNKYLKKLSIVGIFFWFIGSKSNPSEFNRYYSLISIFYSLVFLTSWIFSKQNKVISQLNQYIVDIPRNSNQKDARSVLIKKLLFIPISTAFVVALVVFQLFCFCIEIYINQIYSGPFGSILGLIPTGLISVFIPILTIIYNQFFIKVYVNLENGSHSKKSTLEKNFILLFFSNYMPLLITLFLYLPFGHLFTSERIIALSTLGLPINTNALYLSINTSRHQSQFFYFIFTNQIIIYVTTYILPIVLKRLADKKAKKDKKNKNTMELTLKNEYPKDYKSWKKAQILDAKITDTFDVDLGYQKLILQFGFIAMFSTIWPLAPLVIYSINQIVLKTDIWKCFKGSRPSVLPIDNNKNIDHDTIDMKPWTDILKLITWISIVICSTITFMYESSYLPGIGHITQLEKRDHWYTYNPLSKSWTSIILFAVLIEHIGIFVYMMLKKYYLEYDDVSTKGYNCYGMVPEIKSDVKFPSEKLSLPVLNGKKPSDSEIETISTMESDQGYKPLADEDSKWKQRKGAPQKNRGDVEDKNLSKPIQDNNETDNGLKPEITNKNVRSEEDKKSHHKTHEDRSFPTENGSMLDPSVVYNNNFALSDSDVAGATLPTIIPTSKNYHLRFDADGNQISSNISLDSEIVHNTPTITSVDKGKISDVTKAVPEKQQQLENTKKVTSLTAVPPYPVTLKNPPVITVEDETAVNTPVDKELEESIKTDGTREKTYPSFASNKSLKSAPMDEGSKKSTNGVAHKSSAQSVHSKHRSILSTASHKISQTRKSIGSNTTHSHTHPQKSKSEDDKDKSKKKKKGLFGKLKI